MPSGLRTLGALRVALGDVDALDAQPLHQLGPASRDRAALATSILCRAAMSISACLTNHDTMPGLAPQQETAVGPVPSLRLQRQQVFAQHVVGARLRYRVLVL